MSKKTRFQTPDVCPVCGEDVPPNARACPECGADERTGWEDGETYLDGVGLPDVPEEAEGMDYDEFMAREFGSGKWKRLWKRLWIPVTAGILLLAFVIWEILR
jgi:zinc-ribbon domain